MIKLEGTWTRIDADETHWQCEFGYDEWDLSCNTCNESSNKNSFSGRHQRMNRAHWRTAGTAANYLCDFHYDRLSGRIKPIEPVIVAFTPVSADEFASAFDTI